MKRARPQRYLFLVVLAVSLVFIFNSLIADEARLIRIRKGDTVSYLSFKTYGMYDPRMLELLQQENPQVKDLNLILAGQQFRFPSPEVMKNWLKERIPPSKEPPPALIPKEPRPPKERPAKEEPIAETKVRANKGVITFLEGQVQVKKGKESNWSSARPNMVLAEKDQIKVAAKSRAELILDNQTVMRLSDNTLLTINQIEEDQSAQKETTNMELSLGRLWTKTAKLFNPASRFDVRTPTAIAGVQGTTYQVMVTEKKATKIQVFQGAVNVYNPFPKTEPPPPGRAPRIGQPQEVAGPSEVAGPTPVSREEWTQIVLRQFQQITVTDQDISRPTSFDVQKERQSEWIRWNEERDVDFQPAERPR